MAFVFPEDKQDFKAPNGILYTYDGEKWLVKSYKEPPPPPPDLSGFVTTEVFEQDQKRQDDDIEAGYDTQSDLLLKNIEQDGRLDTIESKDSEQDGRLDDIEAKDLQQDGRLDDIEAKDLEQDGRLDQQETKNFQQDGRLDFIDEEQGTQNSQINALETQIQLLAQVKATGTWTYERNITSSLRPPNLKKFYGTDVDGAVDNVLTDWGKLRLIMISKTSMEDKTFTFSAFEEGDKVEILAKDGTSACIGTVTNDPTNDSYGNFVVAVEYYKGGPVEGQEYLFSAYRPGANSGDVDLDILDGRYLVKTGGTLTGNLYLDTGSGLFSKEIIKSTRNTGYAFQVKPDDTGDSTAFIHTNGSASFTNVITFSGDSRIKGVDADGNEKFKVFPSGLLDTKGEIRIDRSGTNQSFVVKQDGTPKLSIRADGKATSEYSVTSSDDAQVLTTKEYVDDTVAANRGSDYTLPKATVQDLGGVKIAASGGTWVGATRINDSGTIGVVQSSNVTKGVNYKGQACITGNSTPNASDYQQGCLVFSTATNSLYVRT